MIEKPRPATVELSEQSEIACLSRESFNEQLSITRKLETAHGIAEYALVEPDTYSGQAPVLFIGGFGQGRDTYTEEMYDLADGGHKVVYSNPVKGFEIDSESVYEKLKDKFGISDSLLAKAAELEAIIEYEGLDQIAFVGHSQGGLILSVLAAIRPDLAKHLVLQSPEGFQGEKSVGELAGDFLKQGWMQYRDVAEQAKAGDKRPRKVSKQVAWSFMKEAFGKHPFWRLKTEIPGSSQVELGPILADIKARREATGVGPQIALLNGLNDGLFPPEMYETGLTFRPDVENGEEDEGPFQYVDTWAMYQRKGAGHNAVAIELPGVLRQILSEDGESEASKSAQ